MSRPDVYEFVPSPVKISVGPVKNLKRGAAQTSQDELDTHYHTKRQTRHNMTTELTKPESYSVLVEKSVRQRYTALETEAPPDLQEDDKPHQATIRRGQPRKGQSNDAEQRTKTADVSPRQEQLDDNRENNQPQIPKARRGRPRKEQPKDAVSNMDQQHRQQSHEDRRRSSRNAELPAGKRIPQSRSQPRKKPAVKYPPKPKKLLNTRSFPKTTGLSSAGNPIPHIDSNDQEGLQRLGNRSPEPKSRKLDDKGTNDEGTGDEGIEDMPVGVDEVEGENEPKLIAPSTRERPLIDPEMLKNILDTLKTVGFSHNKTNGFHQIQRPLALSSVSGKNMAKIVNDLKEGYSGMYRYRADQDEHGLDHCHSEVEKFINRLDVQTTKILTTKFGRDNSCSDISKTEFLTDVYFNILPAFVQALKTGVDFYTAQGSLTTPDLEEITRVLNVIISLAETAVKEPKSMQPKGQSGSKTYRIKKPTRDVLHILRGLLQTCDIELRSRGQVDEDAEAKRRAAEQEKKNKEQEAEERAELQRRIMDRRKAQNKTLAERMGDLQFTFAFSANAVEPRSQHRDVMPSQQSSVQAPSQTRYSSQRAAAEEEAKILGAKLREAQLKAEKLRMEEERERQQSQDDKDMRDDPFDGAGYEEVEEVERIHLFGDKNKRMANAPNPWSDEEKAVLVDVLVSQQHPDRYEQLARRLDRSLDEIFEKVKDFKDAMDYAYEQGQMSEEIREWVASIGIELK